MRVVILQARRTPNWSTRRLIEELRRRGHKVATVNVADTSLYMSNEELKIYVDGALAEADAVVVRSLGLASSSEELLRRVAVAAQYEAMGTPVVNPWLPMLIARDKYLSLLKLRNAGLPVPPTLLTENLGAVTAFARRWGRVVFKPLVGSLGLGAFKADNVDLAYHIAATLLSLSRPIYMQAFIERLGGSDIRLFVVDNEVVAAVERLPPPGDWRTNVARGGRTKPYKPSQEEVEIAIRAVETLGLYYAGVDLARSKDGALYVLEVNASPNWRGLFEATGVDPSPLIADLLEKLAKGR